MTICYTSTSFAYTNGSIISSVKINSSTANGPVPVGTLNVYGYGITGIGDLDADGVPDTMVGATGATGGGAGYIHFMNANGSIKSTVRINSSTTNGPALLTGDFYGYALDTIGDLNNDGIDDILVGSSGNDMGGAANTNRGAIFIHYMNRDGSILSTVKIGQGTANGPTLITNDNYGAGVAGIGDLDNDGIPDIAVGATGDDTGGSARGALYIHYMNRNGSIKSTVKIAHGTTNGPTLINSDLYGGRVTNIGDLDDDGIPDIAVGASGDDTGGVGLGAVYIHYMNRNGSIKSTVKITGATANGASLVAGDGYGFGIKGIGDLDADAIPDILVSAFGDDTGGSARGALYIHYMNRNGSIKSTVKIAHGTTNGPVIANDTYYGLDISGAGDVNGDGSIDIVAGVPYDNAQVGAIYLHLMTPTPGVVVTDLHLNAAASTITVIEGEVGDTLTVRLGSAPANDVTITPSITGGQATLSESTLTFTSSNWNEPQILTVTAIDDTTRESTTNHTVSFVAASSDLAYNGITIANVTVDVTDNDAPAINNIPTSLSITEGANDTFEMTLNSQPTNPVTVNLATDNAQGTLSDSSLVFTVDNWNVAQEITVTAVDDDIDEPTSTTNIEITTTSSDLEYHNLSVDDVVVSVTDNDTIGVGISDTSFALVEGENDTFTVSLSSQPTHTVTLNLSLASDNVTLSSSTLTFTTSDWSTPQVITISSIVNDTKGATLTDSITVSVLSSDTAYAALSLSPISISITDDESANIVLSTTTLTLTEGGTGSVTVRLSSEPTHSVTVNLTREVGQSTLSASNLTFTTTNWNTPQTVTITATSDTSTEQNQNDAIVFTTTSSDTNYNNISSPRITITINDTAQATSSTTSGYYIRRTSTVAPSTAPAISQSTKPTPDVLFTKQFLQLGIQDEQVFQLQKFLNERGFIIATTGPGSPGNETEKYGSLTRKAVQAFQKTYQIAPVSGTFGPKTMATANILLKK